MENNLYESLQKLIFEIDKNRDELEQDFYRKKIELTTAYETKSGTLLEQKTKLKKILDEYQENKDRDLYTNEDENE